MKALRFHVNGFLHKGFIVVALNEGTALFEVYKLDENHNVLPGEETEVSRRPTPKRGSTLSFAEQSFVSQIERLFFRYRVFRGADSHSGLGQCRSYSAGG